MYSRRFVTALPLVAALLAGGCSGITDPSKNTVESFSGTVTVLGAATTHNFSVGKNGEVSVRLTSITPNSASLLGTAIGQQFSGGCTTVAVNNFTGLNKDTFAGPIQKGAWCVQVFDSGTLSAAQNYTIQVSHP